MMSLKAPELLIIGERRSGSTTLYEILKHHPEIGMLGQSDYDFFIEKELFALEQPAANPDYDWDARVDIDEYFQLFSDLKRVTAQKDADAFWWQPAHARLAKHLPDTQFIVILRDPVKRAESQYWNEVAKGREELSFPEAIQREMDGGLSDWQKLHLQYRERGCYARSLRKFLNHIPQERLLVVVLENLFANWDIEIKRICDYLKVSDVDLSNLDNTKTNKEAAIIINPDIKSKLLVNGIKLYDRVANKLIQKIAKSKVSKHKYRERFMRIGKVSARDYYKIEASAINNLYDFYTPHNKELEELTGLDLSRWKKA